ncbi:MAG: hypothetical protein GXP08_06440 [Gammaproteobacteria bacterium]|nr:hypothetical protein [Gammaproteobacteria bacterium]
MDTNRSLNKPIGFDHNNSVVSGFFYCTRLLIHLSKHTGGLCLVLLTLGCSDFSGESTKQPPPTAQVQGPPTRGTVLDARRAGGYTYMQLEHNGKKFWIASSIINVQRNDIVSWQGAYVTKNYKSAALKKQFKEIYFVSSIKIEK